MQRANLQGDEDTFDRYDAANHQRRAYGKTADLEHAEGVQGVVSSTAGARGETIHHHTEVESGLEELTADN